MSTNEEFTHEPCCSSHGVPMTCERYRRTHFVEVRPCCGIDRAALESLPTPPAGQDAERFYDLRAYLAKTLDNIENDTHGWAITDVREFIAEALALEPDATPTPPVAGEPEREALADLIHASHRKWCLLDKRCPEAGTSADALLAAGFRREPEPREVTTRNWYRSFMPDGRVWCESSDLQEVIYESEGMGVTYSRLVYTESTDGWKPFTPSTEETP